MRRFNTLAGTLKVRRVGKERSMGIGARPTTGDGDSFINMSTGGMLALYGDADYSLTDFLDLIDGSDAIRHWNEPISDWADITTATPGTDYMLVYIDDAGSDFYGYALLTVRTMATPEPSSLVLLVAGAVSLIGCSSPRRGSRGDGRLP
jgi:hypothetical protein